ncbi:hypothetical protein AAVH_17510, partial [Aphelenchoides avenae]
LYGYFAVAGFLPSMFYLLGGKALIALVGIVFNLDLAWITYRNRSLHGTCNILIALNACSTSLFQVSFLVTFGVVADGTNLVLFMRCVYAQLAPAFGQYFSLCLLVFIGLDRLKSVLLPTVKLQEVYVMTGVAICAAYSAFLIGLSLKVALGMDPCWGPGSPRKALCVATEITQYEAAKLASTSAIVLNLGSVSIYCVLWLVLRRMSKSTRHIHQSDRINRSLYVIIAIEFVGWGSSSLFQQVYEWNIAGVRDTDEYTRFIIAHLISYLLVIATTVNAPVLFAF